MSLKKTVLSLFLFLVLMMSDLFCAELIQTHYSIVLSESTSYQVFEEKPAEGACFFSWEGLPEKKDSYAMTVQTKDLPLKFSSDRSDDLSFSLHRGAEPYTQVILFDQNNFSQSAVWMDKNEGETRLQFMLFLRIPSQQIVPPGTYSCRLELCLYRSDGEKITNKEVYLSLNVPPAYRLEAGLNVNASKHQTIEFGELSMQSTRSAEIKVNANTSYALYAESINHGKLKLDPMWQKPSYLTTEIPYSVVCGGLLLNLDGEASLVVRTTNQYEVQSISYPLNITVFPDPAKHWEGDYTDELLFTIIPNN